MQVSPSHRRPSGGQGKLGNEIQVVRAVFKFGFDAGLMDRPVRFGPGVAKPSAKTLRLHRAKAGPRMFEPTQINAMPAVARAHVKARPLLAVNGGLGNSDLAERMRLTCSLSAEVGMRTRRTTSPPGIGAKCAPLVVSLAGR